MTIAAIVLTVSFLKILSSPPLIYTEYVLIDQLMTNGNRLFNSQSQADSHESPVLAQRPFEALPFFYLEPRLYFGMIMIQYQIVQMLEMVTLQITKSSESTADRKSFSPNLCWVMLGFHQRVNLVSLCLGALCVPHHCAPASCRLEKVRC